MTTSTLLAHLAQFGSFSMQSEVLCTQGLAHLLKAHAGARSALATAVKVSTGIELSDSLTWIPEALQEDGGRPDLEARTDNGIPVVKIEAKLGAALLASQLKSYRDDLRKRNDGDAALLVLVPKGRLNEAANVTAAALGLQGTSPWRVNDGHRHAIAVISWDELFDALESDQDTWLRYELEQLQAMYRVLSGGYIAPLADIKDLLEWRERAADFINLVDEATRRLTTQRSVYPMGTEPIENVPQEQGDMGYRRRYVCRSTGGVETCFSIGVRDPFADWVTPIWMRFRKDTGFFARIRQRIKAASLEIVESSGHIWIPMEVEFDASADEMIQSLVEQAEEVARVAYQTE